MSSEPRERYVLLRLLLDNKLTIGVVIIIVLAFVTGKWDEVFGLLDRLIEYLKGVRT